MEYETILPTTRKPVASLRSITGSKDLTVLILKSSHISKGLGLIKNTSKITLHFLCTTTT